MTSKTEPTPLPWTIGANGDLLDGQGQLVLDGYCLPDHDTMLLIVHRVNHYEAYRAIARKLVAANWGGYHDCDVIGDLVEEARALLCGEGRGEKTNDSGS